MKILFQGDSITDCARSRDNDSFLGGGYPLLIDGELGVTYPNEHLVINRGVSGDRIVDIYARMKKDIINLAPDVMSILVGVNDVWHERDVQNGVDGEKFFKVYSMLLEEVKEAFPNIKLIVLEPFVLLGAGSELRYEWFRKEVEVRAQKAKEVAEKYGAIFVPLQKEFDDLCKVAPATFWLGDGVHPTAHGHEVIKRQWLKAFKNL